MGFQPNQSRHAPRLSILPVIRVITDRTADPLDSSERVPIFFPR